MLSHLQPCCHINDYVGTVMVVKFVKISSKSTTILPDDTVNRTGAGAATYRSDCCTAEIRILIASSIVRKKNVSRDYNDNNP